MVHSVLMIQYHPKLPLDLMVPKDRMVQVVQSDRRFLVVQLLQVIHFVQFHQLVLMDQEIQYHLKGQVNPVDPMVQPTLFLLLDLVHLRAQVGQLDLLDLVVQ
jgi:hypothetical protein